MHYGLQHLVDEHTNFFSDLRQTDQADVLVEFYDEPDNVSEMLGALESPLKDALAVGTRNQFVRLLADALRADLRANVTEAGKADAFRRLGEQVTNWAYNYAERALDQHIELHLEELLDEGSETDRRANALGV